MFTRKARADPCRERDADEAPLGTWLSSSPHLHRDHTTPPRAVTLSIAAKMAQPIVQTIHRDPALLYVAARSPADAETRKLTTPQLVDSAPYHRGHGTFTRSFLPAKPQL